MTQEAVRHRDNRVPYYGIFGGLLDLEVLGRMGGPFRHNY